MKVANSIFELFAAISNVMTYSFSWNYIVNIDTWMEMKNQYDPSEIKHFYVYVWDF